MVPGSSSFFKERVNIYILKLKYLEHIIFTSGYLFFLVGGMTTLLAQFLIRQLGMAFLKPNVAGATVARNI